MAIETYWSSWTHGLHGCEEPQGLERKAVERVHLALLELGAAETILGQIRKNKAWGILYAARVYAGKRVIVDYENGPVEAIFEGVERELPNTICVRHLTTKGKPRKSSANISYGMAGNIHLKDPKPKG